MKFHSLVALLALPLSSAFGPATPIRGQHISNNHGLVMRVSVANKKKRSKITRMLDTVVVSDDPAATKEAIQSTILTDSTEEILQGLGWKVRKAMLRKVRALASDYDVKVESTYGTPMPRLEREALQAEAAASKRATREAHFTKIKEERDDRVKARRIAEAGSEAEKKKREAIRQTMMEEKLAEQEAEQAEIEAAERMKEIASLENAEEAEAMAEEKEEAKKEAKEEAKKEDKE